MMAASGSEVRFTTAQDVADALAPMRALLASMGDSTFCRIPKGELLDAARVVEEAARLVFRAQVVVMNELSAQDVHLEHGMPSPAALCRTGMQLSDAEGRRRLEVARQVCGQGILSGGTVPAQLPVLAEAMTEGAVGVEQVGIVIKGLGALPKGLDPMVVEDAERFLVKEATQCDPRQLDKLVARLRQTLDPDGTLDEDADPRDKVELVFGRRDPASKLTRISGKLDDHTVAALNAALEWFARPEPGSEGQIDPRSGAVRYGQAFTEMLAVWFKTGLANSRHGESAQVTVTADFDAMTERWTGTYSTGMPTDPRVLRELMCNAEMLPVVFRNGEVVDVDVRRRFFTVEQRRAIASRDRGCSFAGCDRPAAWCDSHHVKWYGRDEGPTTVGNGALLCPFHHHVIHQGEWLMEMIDGRPYVVPPVWVDPKQAPRRNEVHHLHTRFYRLGSRMIPPQRDGHQLLPLRT